jgi:hypothetical protein
VLYAKEGDRNPRVVALQILLNRHKPRGIVLAVDGVYGTKTSGGITAYRETAMASSGPGDTADSTLWQHLLRPAKLHVVDAVDISDPAVIEHVVPVLSEWGTPIEMGPMSNGVVQVMVEIRARAKGKKQSLVLVRFHGHGAPGLLAISFGKRSLFPGVHAPNERTVLNADTIGVLRSALAIDPYLADFGFIEMHACKVARGSVGIRMLKDLAEIWKAPVTAGLTSQSMGGKANYVLTAPSYTAFPGDVDLKKWASTRKEALNLVPT